MPNHHHLEPHQTTVFILAAGRGERMRPLTDTTPKPLLKVANQSLIEHHLINLKKAGFRHIVINVAHLAEQFYDELGDGRHYGLAIHYSDESSFLDNQRDHSGGALETAGGIQHALPLIQSEQFLVINADIYTDFTFKKLLGSLPDSKSSRLVLVDNPAHNPSGDFIVADDQILNKDTLNSDTQKSYTFSGIALYQKSLFEKLPAGRAALAPLLKQEIDQQRVDYLIHEQEWHDIGTPERLAELNSQSR